MMELTMDFLKATGQEPRFHGNGFVQLYLDAHRTKRLHVWHPNLPPTVGNAKIHDHRFDMESHILCGMIRHEVFYGVENTKGAYELGELNCIDKMEANIRHLGCFDIFSMGQSFLAPGSYYTFPARNLHTTDNASDGIAATLIFKPQEYPDIFPRIVYPVGEIPDIAFGGTRYNTEELWNAIGDALDTINK